MNLNKLLKQVATPLKPAAPAVKLANRHLFVSRRGLVWRRGTLVLVA